MRQRVDTCEIGQVAESKKCSKMPHSQTHSSEVGIRELEVVSLFSIKSKFKNKENERWNGGRLNAPLRDGDTAKDDDG
jgi:hypothetical protein